MIEKFYKTVDIIEHPESDSDLLTKLPDVTPINLQNLSNITDSQKYWAITLDGRPINTMFKD